MSQQTSECRGRHRRRPDRHQWNAQDTFAAVLMVAFIILAVALFGGQIGHLVTP